MDLVQQVFKYLLILFIITSCTTVNNIDSGEIQTVVLKKNNNIKSETPLNVNNIIGKNNFKSIEITQGSISTSTLINSDIWIGKLGGELLRYNIYTGDTKKYLDNNYSIKDFSIKTIIDLDNKVLALQSDRVIQILKSDDTVKIIQFPIEINRATDIVFYKDKIYISTLGYGLREYNPVTNTFKSVFQDLNYISSLLLSNGNLYIGSMNNGLYCYNLESKTIKSRLDYPLTLFNKNIVKMEMKNDVLWLGTAFNGLIKWNTKTNDIQRIYENESVSSIYLNNEINIVSFIGFGIYVEKNDKKLLESINTILKTNNVTSVKFFNNYLISGNIKKGLIKQETKY